MCEELEERNREPRRIGLTVKLETLQNIQLQLWARRVILCQESTRWDTEVIAFSQRLNSSGCMTGS